MSSQENKDLVYRFFEGINQRNFTLLDEVCEPGSVHHAGWGEGLNLEQFKNTATALFEIFHESHYEPDDVLAEGETVGVRWTFQAVHAGEYMGIAGTGKPVRAAGVIFFRIRNRKIYESWEVWDRFGLLQQLGTGLAPGPSTSR